jgi:hypothetical protein
MNHLGVCVHLDFRHHQTTTGQFKRGALATKTLSALPNV